VQVDASIGTRLPVVHHPGSSLDLLWYVKEYGRRILLNEALHLVIDLSTLMRVRL
jgi:hypothetical protein